MTTEATEAGHGEYELPQEEYIAIGKDALDITLIVNEHGDAQSAHRVLEKVEPNSIVFIEGFNEDMRPQGSRGDLMDALWDLSLLHAQHGPHDPDYLSYKVYILTALDTQLQKTLSGKFNETELGNIQIHAINRLIGLLHKDCFVFYADYQHDPQKEAALKAMGIDMERMLQAMQTNGRLHVNPQTVQSEGIHSTYKEIRANYMLFGATHHIREAEGVGKAAYLGGVLIHSVPTLYDYANVTPDKKIKSYFIWGGAHVDSLLSKFESQGMPVSEVVDLMEGVEGRKFLNPDQKDFIEQASNAVIAGIVMDAFSSMPLVCHRAALSLDPHDPVSVRKFRIIEIAAEQTVLDALQEMDPDQSRAILIRSMQCITRAHETREQLFAATDEDEIVSLKHQYKTDIINIYRLLEDAGVPVGEVFIPPYDLMTKFL